MALLSLHTPPPIEAWHSTMPINDVTIPLEGMLPPNALTRVSLPPPVNLLTNAYNINNVIDGDPPNKRKGTDTWGAIPSPLRKKKAPSSSTAQSPHWSVVAAAFLLIAAIIVTHTPPVDRTLSPTSTIANVFYDVPATSHTKKKAKTTTKLKMLRTWHVPSTEFLTAPREENHYKKDIKYSETRIKSDL